MRLCGKGADPVPIQLPEGPCSICGFIEGRWAWEPVARNGVAVAFVNRRQRSRGALLVAPFAHVTSILDLSAEETGELLLLARHVMARLEARLAPDGMHLFWTYGAPAGQSEEHLHLQLVPRYDGVGYSFASTLSIPLTPRSERKELARLLTRRS
jgi:diadenosine tetraphosphate (Ap4A) HIT family hydrolase